MPPVVANVALTDEDTRYLRGERGTGAALAMRVVLAVSASMGASRLVDIESAHVDGCIYVGSVSIDFARALVDGGARVSVPTTLNVGSVDLQHPRNWNGTAELADNARTLMSLYTALGCEPTWTCAPYLLTPRPRFGAHIAWGESNAIAFANSVLGARTQRYGDFVDIAAAVVGRAPFAGLHTDEGRLGEVLIDVTGLPADAVRRDSFFPLLGHLVGQWCGSRIPVVSGLGSATEDQLKAFGAAAASTGAVALFHIVGVTPEAHTSAEAFGGRPAQAVHRVTIEHLRRAWTELCTRRGGTLAAVCVGTPHFSLDRISHSRRIARGATGPSRYAVVCEFRPVGVQRDSEPGHRPSARIVGRADRHRHLHLHHADPGQAERPRDDQLGQVGVVRPAKHRCRRAVCRSAGVCRIRCPR